MSSTPHGQPDGTPQSAGSGGPSGSTPKRPWFKKKRFMIPLAVVAIGVVYSAASGGSGQETTSTPTGQSSAAAGNQTPNQLGEDKLPGLGTPVRDGKFEFVASKMTCGIKQVGNEYLNEKAQGQFCVLDVTAKNIGDEPQTFFTNNQDAFSGSTKYSSNSTAAMYYATQKGLDSSNWIKEINPGNQLAAAVVFDIPADKTIDKGKLHDSVFSGGVEIAVK